MGVKEDQTTQTGATAGNEEVNNNEGNNNETNIYKSFFDFLHESDGEQEQSEDEELSQIMKNFVPEKCQIPVLIMFPEHDNWIFRNMFLHTLEHQDAFEEFFVNSKDEADFVLKDYLHDYTTSGATFLLYKLKDDETCSLVSKEDFDLDEECDYVLCNQNITSNHDLQQKCRDLFKE